MKLLFYLESPEIGGYEVQLKHFFQWTKHSLALVSPNNAVRKFLSLPQVIRFDPPKDRNAWTSLLEQWAPQTVIGTQGKLHLVALVCRERNIPFHWLCGFPPTKSPAPEICTSLALLSENIIVCSEFLRSQIPENWKLPTKVFPVGISPPDIPNEALKIEVRRKLSISPSTFVVGTAGRFTPHKRHTDLLNAFATLSHLPIELVLLGDARSNPPLAGSLWQTIQSNQLVSKVHWINAEPDQVSYFYSAFDLYVAPSVEEGIGCAALEAMGIGIPILYANTGGMKDAFRNCPAAASFRAKNVHSLRSAILRIFFQTYQRRTQIRNLGRPWVKKHFPVANMVAAFESAVLPTPQGSPQ